MLEELASLRREAAALLGYASHAHYVLETRMARSPEAVATFLSDLCRDLRPLHGSELASLSARKLAAEGADAGALTMADYRFYQEAELKAMQHRLQSL